jgi:S-adenosylmethionine-diacylgycerolhomoserine-N-methlytransferase
MSVPAARERPLRGLTPLERYYSLHAGIYDATRWSFLFGRRAILEEVAAMAGSPGKILEVGCGTGMNLARLGQLFPQAELTGLDLSSAMLERARAKIAPLGRRIRLIEKAYGAPLADRTGYDLVLFSYALTMFNPGFEQAIGAAWRDLRPGGRIAVVDFHDTRFRLFEQWMGVNHVRMNGQLLPILREQFKPKVDRLCAAYAGAWRYLMFVGQKGDAGS